MKKKLIALALVCIAFAGCAQVDQAKDAVNQAPSDFWMAVRSVLGFLVDVVSNVAFGWLRGLFGL